MDQTNFPSALYLGLATAIAGFTAAAVTLDLLKPHGRWGRWSSFTVVLVSVLGIAAAFIAVAREEASATLHVAIAAGLVAPGLFVLIRALDEIVQDRSVDPPLRRSKQLALVSTIATLAVLGLLMATTPELLETIFKPEQSKAPPAGGGFSPSARTVFSCLEHSRDCPGPGYPAFNSYRNTPSYGDERAFLDARLEHRTEAGSYENVLKVTPGQRVVVRAYFNNNGDARFESRPGDSVARGTRMRVLLPRGRRETLNIAASISAVNARPKTVSDTVVLWSDEPIEVRYIAGTSLLFNDAYPRGLRLTDDLVSDGIRRAPGALVGYRRLDGVVAGRFEEAGIIELTLTVL